ncbi:MAG: hypothetical protein AAF632_05595 [Bacteroidota bacterium]
MRQITIEKTLLITIILSIATRSLQAQENEEPNASFTITANPSFFVLGGYSVKGLYHLPQRWSFGVALEANFELPDFARDQFFENNGDITVDWDYLVGVEARYRFTDSNVDKGFYVLGTLGYEGWTISDQMEAEDTFDNWYSSIGVGYNWYPFKKPKFHVGASYNVVFILNNTNDRTVGQSEFNIRPVVPPSFAPTIYLGWRF